MHGRIPQGAPFRRLPLLRKVYLGLSCPFLPGNRLCPSARLFPALDVAFAHRTSATVSVHPSLAMPSAVPLSRGVPLLRRCERIVGERFATFSVRPCRFVSVARKLLEWPATVALAQVHATARLSVA